MKCSLFLIAVSAFTQLLVGPTSGDSGSPFTQEPEDVWVVRDEPVKIFCSALDVIKIVFYCNDDPVSNKHQTTKTDGREVKSFISKSLQFFFLLFIIT